MPSGWVLVPWVGLGVLGMQRHGWMSPFTCSPMVLVARPSLEWLVFEVSPKGGIITRISTNLVTGVSQPPGLGFG